MEDWSSGELKSFCPFEVGVTTFHPRLGPILRSLITLILCALPGSGVRRSQHLGNPYHQPHHLPSPPLHSWGGCHSEGMSLSQVNFPISLPFLPLTRRQPPKFLKFQKVSSKPPKKTWRLYHMTGSRSHNLCKCGHRGGESESFLSGKGPLPMGLSYVSWCETTPCRGCTHMCVEAGVHEGKKAGTHTPKGRY